MTSVDQLDLSTVINKEEFSNNAIVKECPNVGRSLVAKRPLVPGDIVLIEEPLIKYRLKPTCRSSNSPYYSKKIWRSLINIVQQLEKTDSKDNVEIQKKEECKEYSDDDDSYKDYSNDEESDEESEEEEAEINTDSDFCPGVPAAIMAYLEIHPPSNQYSNVRPHKTYQSDDFDFFYYPNVDQDRQWLDHDTIQLIISVSTQVVEQEPLFSHVDPVDLCSFVLKIYSNAHTVSLPRSRTNPTHPSKKARREMYKSKSGENSTYWGEEATDLPATPTIALLRWGSKFAHSCSPNMFLRFEPTRNAMIFTVVTPLKEGDILSFSYLPEDDSTVGGLICGTSVDRQARLEQFKFFTCACERCVDWDWSRGVVCTECHEPVNYRSNDSIWTCFACGAKTSDEQASFIGDREKNVVRSVMGFVARVNGNRRMNESMMRMLEPYLLDLLNPAEGKNEIPVPKNHWTFGMIHSLLAFYHLVLFPQSFGRGLASQLCLTVKGLEEVLVYIEFLNSTIRMHANEKSKSNGCPMAAFFAGWRTLTLVIDFIMDSTENKYANVTYEKEDYSSSSDSESESESDTNHGSEPKEKNTEDKETAAENKQFEVHTEPVNPILIPLPQDWVAPVVKISNIASKEWIPLIDQIFKNQKSEVIEDMLSQIKSFAERVEKTSSPSAIEKA